MRRIDFFWGALLLIQPFTAANSGPLVKSELSFDNNTESRAVAIYPPIYDSNSFVFASKGMHRPLIERAFPHHNSDALRNSANPVHPLIKRIELDTSYRRNSLRFYPLLIHVENSGGTKAIQAICTAKLAKKKMNKLTFVFNEDTTLSLPLSSDQIERIVDESIQIKLSKDDTLYHAIQYKPTAPAVLNSLFSAQDLSLNTRTLKPLYENYRLNKTLYTTFSRKPLPRSEELLYSALKHALHEEWDAFVDVFKPLFTELKTFSKEIKKDTIHVIYQLNTAERSKIMQNSVTQVESAIQSALQLSGNSLPVTLPAYADLFASVQEKNPRLIKELQKATQKHPLFIINGVWSTIDPNLTGGEALVRQLLYGKRYFLKNMNINCVTALLPFPNSLRSNLPQLFIKSGFKFLAIQSGNHKASLNYPSVFKWTALDKSSIPTGHVRNMDRLCNLKKVGERYLTGKTEKMQDVALLYNIDHSDESLAEALDCMDNMKTLTAFPGVYENNLGRFIKRTEDKSKSTPVFYEKNGNHKHSPLVITHARLQRKSRQNELALKSAEKLAVLAGIPYCRKQFHDLWTRTLSNQPYNPSSAPALKTDIQKAEQQQIDLNKTIKKLTDQFMQTLAENINTGGKGQAVVVFNPLNWQRNGVIDLFIPNNEWIKSIKSRSDKRVPFQKRGKTISFLAKDVPAMGYKTFWLQKKQRGNAQNHLLVSETRLENEFFKIEINPANGNINAFFDKRIQRNLVAKNRSGNALCFFQPSEKMPLTCNEVQHLQIIEKGPVRATLRLVRSLHSSTFIQDYIIYSDIPRLDIHTLAEWHEKKALATARFPFNIEAKRLAYDVPYGHVDQETGTDRNSNSLDLNISTQKYIDLSDSSCGISILHQGRSVFDLRNHALAMHLLHGIPISCNKKAEDHDRICFSDQGAHEFSYALFPHKNTTQHAQLCRKSYEFNVPLIATICEPHKGKRPPVHSFIQTGRENVIVTTLKRAEDGEALILRLYETKGEEAQIRLKIALPFSRVWECNLMEKKHKTLALADNSILLNIRPHEIMTLWLQ